MMSKRKRPQNNTIVQWVIFFAMITIVLELYGFNTGVYAFFRNNQLLQTITISALLIFGIASFLRRPSLFKFLGDPPPIKIPQIFKNNFYDTTFREQERFLNDGFGHGWRRVHEKMISNDNANDTLQKYKIEVLKWLAHTYTDKEFEVFCTHILNDMNFKNLRVTEKRRGSNADGGIDGYGTDILGRNIIFQAKIRRNPSKQLGTDAIQSLIGATLTTPLLGGGTKDAVLMNKKVHTSYFITNAKISDLAYDIIDWDPKNLPFTLEAIDGERLLSTMMKNPRKFGLHLSEGENFFYINPEAIKKLGKISP